MHLRGNAAGVLVTLLVVGGVATACGSGSAATTSTTSTTVPVASAGKAPSLSLLPSSVQAQVTDLLRQRHKIVGDADDFTIRNQQEFTDAATSTSRVLTVLVVSIASVSLVVGGIGIMNIMLVSVTERTREIGRPNLFARRGERRRRRIGALG